MLLREERLVDVRYGIILRHDASRVNWLRRDRNRDRAQWLSAGFSRLARQNSIERVTAQRGHLMLDLSEFQSYVEQLVAPQSSARAELLLQNP